MTEEGEVELRVLSLSSAVAQEVDNAKLAQLHKTKYFFDLCISCQLLA